jgi:uncharacterized protein YbjT (DUF2867 family)
MRYFVIGASSWIGSAVVPELIDVGHQVVGLARPDASAAALTEAGARVQRGTLDDLDVLREAAATLRHQRVLRGALYGSRRRASRTPCADATPRCAD